MKLKSFLACLFLALPLAAQDDRPVVTGPWMNAGSPQRSMIQSIGVTFDRNVSDLVKLESLKVKEVETGNMVDLADATLIFDPRNNSANWMINRDTSALLSDGNYLAWIETDTLLEDSRRAACAASALPLDDYVFGFHQMAGDTDGDRDVDFRDSCVLRETWLQTIDGTTFRSFLDFDLSSRVDEGDRGLFAQTYFSLLPAEPAIHLFLRNDTGDSPSDNATSLYSFGFDSVELDDASTWRLSLGGLQTDITSAVTAGGGVILEDVLDNLAGNPLTPGNYSVTIEALNENGEVLASDTLDFEYLGDVLCGPYFTSTPTSGISLGQSLDSQPLNLSNWTTVQWPGSQANARWDIAPDGLSVNQAINSSPSGFISPESVLNLRITGRFRVNTNSDDDLMGFVFGLQNEKQFYIFDWKQQDQPFFGGSALRGMSIKKLDVGDGEFTEEDFFWSDQNRANSTILLPPNDIPWKDFQIYDITLEFTLGLIVVEVWEEGVLLDRLEAEDDSFSGGRFGFYNYSQDNVIYEGFSQEALNNGYFYDANAFDPDGGTITYSLGQNTDGSQAPEGATINPTNGALIWEPTEAGTFPFTIVATDNDGLTDTQRFNVVVTPIDLPPVVNIVKTAPSVIPDEPVSLQVIASDDEQLFRVRLFIDDLEVELDEQFSYTTTFSEIGTKELRAVAIDSAEQVSEITSYVRVLDPDAINPEGQNSTLVAPPGQTPGTPTDLRPLVSFQAPTSAKDDPTLFVGTVNPNGSQLAQWFLEWAPAATVKFDNLASQAVLWQELEQGTDPFDATQFATITPGDFPNELIAFRLRAANQNGLGAISTIVFNPQTNSTNGPAEIIDPGAGAASPTAAFTAPLTASADLTAIRGTVDPTTGTLQSWVLDYAPQGDVNSSDLRDPSVAWTILSQDTTPVSDALLATLDPAGFSNQTYVFRLTAINEGGGGAIATVIFNPTSSNFGGPTGTTGVIPATAERPVCRIISPVSPGDDRSSLIGSIFSNGGTLERWVVDYAPRTEINPQNLSDPSVSWTLLTEGTNEKDHEKLAALDVPDFQNGLWIIRARAFNTNGLGCLATTLLDTGDTSLPAVAILSPEAEDDITYITEARGTVTNGGGVLDSWALEIAPTSEVSLANLNAPANWRLIGSGNTPFEDEPLGMIDPTGLQNGSYVLRLSARNTNGRGIVDGIIIHVCGEAKLGNFRLEFQDLNIPLAGIPIQINRIYDTLNANRSSDFGFGWTLGIGDPDLRETVPDTGDSFFFATPFEVGTRVFLTTPDGRRVGFTFNVRNPRNRFLYVDYEPYFEPDPGVYETLTIAPVDFERVEVGEDGAVYTPLLPFGYNPDRYRLTTRDGLVYHYDQRYGLQEISGPGGQKVTFSSGSINHSSGEEITIVRDSQNKITQIIGPGGRELSYLYDSRGDLVRFQDSAAPDAYYNYLDHPAHFLKSISNSVDAAAGIPTFQVAYENGVVSGFFDREGNNISQQSYDRENFSGTQTDARGNVTTLTYSTRGNVLSATSPLGFVTAISYDDPNNPDLPTTITGPNGNTKSYVYNSVGRPVQETRADGIRTELEYASNDLVSEIKLFDTEGSLIGQISAEYNDRGMPTKVTAPSGNVRTFSYDALGRIIESSDFGGIKTTYTYLPGNQTDQPNQFTTGTETSTVEYDSQGNITRLVNPSGNEIEFLYTVNGQVLSATQNGNLLFSKSYNEAGQLIEEVNSGVTKNYSYDGVGNVTAITEVSPTGTKAVALGYDKGGNLTLMADSEGLTYEFSYDADGRQVRAVSPGGDVSTSKYDGNSNLIELTDRRGYIRKFSYDIRNRRTREEWFTAPDTDAVKTITSNYDSRGQLTTIQDGTTIYQFGFQPDGLIQSMTNTGSVDLPLMEQTFGYDEDGRQTTVSDHLGVTLSTNYDSRGRISSIEWDNLPVGQQAKIEFSRNGSGALERIERFTDLTNPDPTSTSIIERNSPTGAISRIQHLSSTLELLGPQLDFQFTRDPQDRVTSQSAGSTTIAYGYDASGQLESSSSNSPDYPNEFYNYDSNGNRTNSHLGGSVTYGPRGLPQEDTLYRYRHDEERNLIEISSKSDGTSYHFSFDHRNRMTGIVKKLDGNEVTSLSLRYDPLDRIVARTQDGTTVYSSYLGEGEQIWADLDESGQIQKRYLASNQDDHIFAFWSPDSGLQWPLQDQIGSTRAILRDNGSVSDSINYDSFGQTLSGEDSLVDFRFGFTGREHLMDDIYNLRTRAYSGRLGRFFSEDTIGFLGGDTNLHRYAYNDPLQFVDPMGTVADLNVPSLQQAQAGQATIAQSLATFARTVPLRLAKGLYIGASLSVAVDLVCLTVTGDPMAFFDLKRIARKAGNGAIAGLIVATIGVAIEAVGIGIGGGAATGGGTGVATANSSMGSRILGLGKKGLSSIFDFAFKGAIGSVKFGAAGIGILNGLTNLGRSVYSEAFGDGKIDCNGGFLPGVF